MRENRSVIFSKKLWNESFALQKNFKFFSSIQQVVLEHQRDVRLSDQLPHPLLPCLRPNHLPAALPQQQRPRSHEGRVSNANLHIAPDGAYDRVELLSLQGGPAEGDAQVVAVDDEAERALVHVQHHGELVGNGELVVRAEPAGVGGLLLVVEAPRADDVPAPGLGVGADQGAVACGNRQRRRRKISFNYQQKEFLVVFLGADKQTNTERAAKLK